MILSFLLLSADSVHAAWHLYLTTTTTISLRWGTVTVPSHFYVLGIPTRTYFFGNQPYALVAADVTDGEDTILQSYADVQRLPDNLDQQIGGALATVQGLLEKHNIPADWITGPMTYRIVIKAVLGMFAFANRYPSVTGRRDSIFENFNLDSTWSTVPAAAQSRLAATVKSFGFDTTFVTGSTTIRQILKNLSDQWLAKRAGIKLGPIVIAHDGWIKWFRRALKETAIAWAAYSIETFNRTNQSPITTGWTTMTGYDYLQIVNNRAQAVTGQWGGQSYTTFTPSGDDQVAAATIANLYASGVSAVHILLNQPSGFFEGYLGSCGATWEGIFAYHGGWQLVADDSNGCVVNDRLSLSVTSGDLALTVNGVSRLTYEDGAPLSGGGCGMIIEYTTTQNDTQADNFFCADYGSVPANLPRRSILQ